MEVVDDRTILALPGLVADHLHIQNFILCVISVSMFAVFQVNMVGTIHRAVPAGQHIAVIFSVVVGPGLPIAEVPALYPDLFVRNDQGDIRSEHLIILQAALR